MDAAGESFQAERGKNSLLRKSRQKCLLSDLQSSKCRCRLVLSLYSMFLNAEAKCESRVIQWVYSEEIHTDGGKHYDMPVKLDRKRRWLHVRNYADKTHEVKLNFSSVHSNYYSVWKYTTKEDNEYLQS